ncbi:acrB/AcrD/AcrF family protein [Neorickettsia helminthoeca str. Oregon]|uniref:AcrB/AcrD/AcrF family protein n=1 Tax=Neorickettsia helminthoeca str. Oregon TaxID=1286528 RepID=X5H3K8_9RICK|nr:efflux RND transporter permease subunit [Neorickettsia helminthoeca]AHX11141.1 acrB/AcrD/AcrF family protein [Neorickettsia helminthoeca str. Oregon]
MLDFLLKRNKAVIVLWLILIAFGSYACFVIPKEQAPSAEVPYILVNTVLGGISAKDSAKFLSQQLEDSLRSIEHLKEITSQSMENTSHILMEFDFGFDSAKAIASIRDELDKVMNKLPNNTFRPTIKRISTELIPVVAVVVSSDLGTEETLKIASKLQKRLNSLPNVLSTKMIGKRNTIVEITVDPKMLMAYNISMHNIVQTLTQNNILIPSGSFPGTEYSISVNGLVEQVNKIKELPVLAHGDSLLTIGDVAKVETVLEKEKSISRINGVDTIVVEVSKMIGKNLLETIQQVNAEVISLKRTLSEGVRISIEFDTSKEVTEVLIDLKNNVILTTILVVGVMAIYIGWKIAFMTAFTIPGSLLVGVLLIYVMGFTMNIVVLFSLIMSIGMIVDAAVIVNEYADRKMLVGLSPTLAYRAAAAKMFWPVLSSTGTTLIVLVPLLFWPGLAGKFMKFLPITLIFTLSASVVMSIVFTPVLGSMIGTPSTSDPDKIKRIAAIDSGDASAMSGIHAKYYKLLDKFLDYPKTLITSILMIVLLGIVGYWFFGKGFQFLPNVDPKSTTVLIKASDNLTLKQKRQIVESAEEKICSLPGIKTCYTTIGTLDNDAIGKIQIELIDWKKRRTVREINSEVEEKIASIEGIQFELLIQRDGPIQEKPIKIAVSGTSYENVRHGAMVIKSLITNIKGATSITDDAITEKLGWSIVIDKKKASLYGVDTATIGHYVMLATKGALVGEYRGDDYDEKLDILLVLPEKERNVASVMNMMIPSHNGLVPLSSFLTIKPENKVTSVKRVNSDPTIHIHADVLPGFLAHNIVSTLEKAIKNRPELSSLSIRFKGEQQEQEETSRFLLVAFVASVFCMILILLLQFNSFYQVFIIIAAVVLSTGGVILGLLITHQPFIVVMSGIGIISLAGIVVNNNILLIDAYNDYASESEDKKHSIMRAALSRFRPILLTSGTTVLGLLPMVGCITIDFINFGITYGAPATQWWQSLSTTVAGGLSFTTILTLFLTPALLMLMPDKPKTK